MGLCQGLVCAWETKRVTNAFVLGLYPPVPCYVQECWRSELPDGSLSGESSLAGRISVVMSWTLMLSYSSIAASVNLVTTSLSDSYHDLVWYHVTTVVCSYEAELIDELGDARLSCSRR